MKTQLIYNSDLHFEHLQWKKELLLWKDEIKSFQKRIKEISSKWSNEKVLAEFGQFQHDFGIEEHNINELIREIDEHEHNISQHLKKCEDCIDRVFLKGHENFRYNLTSERNIYNNLKNRFYCLLAKYL